MCHTFEHDSTRFSTSKMALQIPAWLAGVGPSEKVVRPATICRVRYRASADACAYSSVRHIPAKVLGSNACRPAGRAVTKAARQSRVDPLQSESSCLVTIYIAANWLELVGWFEWPLYYVSAQKRSDCNRPICGHREPFPTWVAKGPK